MSETLPSRGRILLAEDYEPNAQFITDALEMEGYEVDRAINGRVAVEKAQGARYAAIIMDIEMPEVDGIAATQAIRRREKADNSAAVPVLGITGHTMMTIRRLCLEAGMNELIVKPFLPTDLYDRLEALTATH